MTVNEIQDYHWRCIVKLFHVNQEYIQYVLINLYTPQDLEDRWYNLKIVVEPYGLTQFYVDDKSIATLKAHPRFSNPSFGLKSEGYSDGYFDFYMDNPEDSGEIDISWTISSYSFLVIIAILFPYIYETSTHEYGMNIAANWKKFSEKIVRIPFVTIRRLVFLLYVYVYVFFFPSFMFFF